MNYVNTNKWSHRYLVMAVLIIGRCSLFAANIDFNTYSSATDNDLVNNFLAEGSFQQVTGNGITGGAVSSTTPTGGDATYRTAQSQPTFLSIAFRYEQTPSFGSGPTARLGWVGDLERVDFFTRSLYFWGEFYNDGALGVRNAIAPATGTDIILGSISPPTFGHWLELSFEATPLGAANYRLGLRLDDLGSDGLQTPSQLFSGVADVVNASAAADTSMYPGFFGYYHADYYDNFFVVPEPSTLVLGVLGVLSLAICIRRKTSTRA